MPEGVCQPCPDCAAWRAALGPVVYGTSTAAQTNTPAQYAESVRKQTIAFRNALEGRTRSQWEDGWNACRDHQHPHFERLKAERDFFAGIAADQDGIMLVRKASVRLGMTLLVIGYAGLMLAIALVAGLP